MKRLLLWGSVAVAGAALFLIVSAAPQMKAPTDGPGFWTYITKTDPYATWHLWPGHEAMHPGQSPHGAFLKIYVNTIAYAAIEKKATHMPAGAIIVKENYAEDKKTLVAVTPMAKVPGYDPAAGDWFWAEYGPTGQVMASGRVQACIDCHAKKKDTDYIVTWSK